MWVVLLLVQWTPSMKTPPPRSKTSPSEDRPLLTAGGTTQGFLEDFVFQGELVLFGGGVENASAVSLFKKLFLALFFFGGEWPSFGGWGRFPLNSLQETLPPHTLPHLLCTRTTFHWYCGWFSVRGTTVLLWNCWTLVIPYHSENNRQELDWHVTPFTFCENFPGCASFSK